MNSVWWLSREDHHLYKFVECYQDIQLFISENQKTKPVGDQFYRTIGGGVNFYQRKGHYNGCVKFQFKDKYNCI